MPKNYMTEQVSTKSKKDVKPIKFVLRKAHHFWRNRISMSTSKPTEDLEQWDYIIDKRVAGFYKPYSHFLNFSNLVVVAHRNILSIYNMSADENYRDFVD